MAASDHVHPQQLRMFIPAKELHTVGMVSEEAIAQTAAETPDELWDLKLTESKRNAPFDISRHEQISKHGILHPVVLTDGGTKIRDGHHRIAIANELNPDTEVPVEYKERSEAHDFKG